jgi:hypothetical protein
MYELKITLKTPKPQKTFSEAFKKKVVRKYEQGLLNKDQLQVNMDCNKRTHLSCLMLTSTQMHGQTKLKIKTWAKKNHKNFGGFCDFF